MNPSEAGPERYWAIHKGTPPRRGIYRVFGENSLVLGFAYWFGDSWGPAFYTPELVKAEPSPLGKGLGIETWAYCKPALKREIVLALSTLRGVISRVMTAPGNRTPQLLRVSLTHVDGKPWATEEKCHFVRLPAYVAFQHPELCEGACVQIIGQALLTPPRQWRHSTQDGSLWFEAVTLQQLPIEGSVIAAPTFALSEGCLVIATTGANKTLSKKATRQLKAMLAIQEVSDA